MGTRQQRRAKELALEKEAAQKVHAETLVYSDLTDRQIQGCELFVDWQRNGGKRCITMSEDDDSALWFGSRNDPYRVERQERNKRGQLTVEYRCPCGDFKKNGAVECKHIVADRLRRNELVITNAPTRAKHCEPAKKAERRPKRRRIASNGRPLESMQRQARAEMGERIPTLIVSLGNAYQRYRDNVVPIRPERQAGRIVTPDVVRAQALLHKIAAGKSADAMVGEYGRLISEGRLRLESAPHQNTLSSWMNDERLTPVLRELLLLTSKPFRKREIGAIIDSSKVSQLRSAHARWVEYEGDERPAATWMKCHAIAGVETLVVMDAIFSGAAGEQTHDINFLKPLVTKALETFDISYVLADKAYLSGDVLQFLWDRQIRATIQLKKGWFRDGDRYYSDAVNALVKWFDQDNNRIFHEVYRLRPKIEALFSILKRLAGEHVWSRGRRPKGAKTSATCTAWVNEVLCKFIYLNLRTTVLLEKETGYSIDYLLPDRHFPTSNEPLLTKAA